MRKNLTLASRSNSAHSEERVNASRLLHVLWRGRFLLIGSVVLCVLLALAYIWVTPKQYRADALLQIKQDTQGPLANFSSSGQGMGAAATLFGISSNSAAESEIPIVLSRSVIGPTVKDLALDVRLAPASSIWGRVFSNESDGSVVNRIQIAKFDVPPSLVDRTFTLRIKSQNQYELYGPSDQKLVTGHVGQKAIARIAGQAVTLTIASIPPAAVGRRYTVVRHHWLSAEKGLANALLVQVKSPSTDILSISFADSNPRKAARVVNSVIDNYVDYGKKAAAESARKSLKFINGQLPQLQSKLDKAESKLASYQKHNQPVTLSAAGQALLQQDTAIESSVTQTKMHIAELKQQYTSNFPGLQAAQDKLSTLRNQRSNLQQKIKKLPGNEQEMLGLQRKVEVYTQLYTALLQRVQQLRVMQAAAIDNTHVVDRAVVPVEPFWPRTKLLILIAGFLGLLLGSALVLARFALREGVRDARGIERLGNVRVFATLPFSNELKRASDRARSGGRAAPVATRDDIDQAFVQSLRELRAGLVAEASSASGQILIVSSMGRSEGATTVAVHLAHLLALSRRRVALVSTDFADGQLERYLESGDATDRQGTLSYVLEQPFDDNIVANSLRTLPGTAVAALPAGKLDDKTLEPLYDPKFSMLMAHLRREYDDVIVLSGAIESGDTAILGRVCGESKLLLGLQSGRYSQERIDAVVESLRAKGVTIAGLVLNEILPA